MMAAACILIIGLGSDAYSDFFQHGNAAYARGDMVEAIRAYEELVRSGVTNPEVFYNLGNAWYHEGDAGRAVLNYERAIGLNSGFAPASRSLALAISETKHQRDRPAGFALHGRGPSPLFGLPRPIVTWGTVVIWWFLWGILAARKRATRRGPSRIALVAWALLALCVVVIVFPDPQPRAAVVVSTEVPMRYGPDRRDTIRTLLAPGDRVVVDRQDESWARVETADGLRGWVERPALALVGPPFDITLTERDNQPR